jgi:hypothetical protein
LVKEIVRQKKKGKGGETSIQIYPMYFFIAKINLSLTTHLLTTQGTFILIQVYWVPIVVLETFPAKSNTSPLRVNETSFHYEFIAFQLLF